MQALITLLVFATYSSLVVSRGRLWEPPGRSSMWRRGYKTPINYQDDKLTCGVADTQTGYKCGVCGDPFHGTRHNEAGGKYATGQITRAYTQGQRTTFQVHLTEDSRGYFEFKICPTNDRFVKETQECFDQHPISLADGSGTRYNVTQGKQLTNVDAVLPPDIICNFCVLQWRFISGDSVSTSRSGRRCVGCDHHEESYGCSDIRIEAIYNSGQSHPTISELNINEEFPGPNKRSFSDSESNAESILRQRRKIRYDIGGVSLNPSDWNKPLNYSSIFKVIHRVNFSQPGTPYPEPPVVFDPRLPIFNNYPPWILNILAILRKGKENVLEIIHRYNISVSSLHYHGSGVSPSGLNYTTTVELLWIKQILAAIGSGTGNPDTQYINKYLLNRLFLSGALHSHVDNMWVNILLSAFGKSSSTWDIIHRLNISQAGTHDLGLPVFNNNFYPPWILNILVKLGNGKENVSEIIHRYNISVPSLDCPELFGVSSPGLNYTTTVELLWIKQIFAAIGSSTGNPEIQFIKKYLLDRLFISGALHGHVSNMWVQILLSAFGTSSSSWHIIRWLNTSQPGTPSPGLPVPTEPTPPVFPIFPTSVPEVPITPVFNNTYYPQWVLNILVILGNGKENVWEIIRRFNITVPKFENPGSGVSPPGLNYTTTVELLWIKQIFAAIGSGTGNPEIQFIKKYLLDRLFLSGALHGHVSNMWVQILLRAFGTTSFSWDIIYRLNISQPGTPSPGLPVPAEPTPPVFPIFPPPVPDVPITPVFNNTYYPQWVLNILVMLGNGNENVWEIIRRFNIIVPKIENPGSGVSPSGLNYTTTVELLWIKQIFAAIGSGTGNPEIQFIKKYLLHRLFLSGALHGHVSNMWVQILLRAFGTTSFSWDIIRWLNISQPGTPSPELPVPTEPTPPVFPIFPPPVPDVPITPVFNNTYYPQWILNISVILGNGNQNFWEIIRRFNITVPKIDNPGSGVSPPGLNYTTTVELLWIKQIFAAIESGPENPETQYIKKYLLYRLYLSGALRGHVDNMWVQILLCAFGKSSSTWNIITRLNISQPGTPSPELPVPMEPTPPLFPILPDVPKTPVFNNTYYPPWILNILVMLGNGNENVWEILRRFNITVPKIENPGSGVSPSGLNYTTTVELLWIKQIFAAIGSGTGNPEIQFIKKYLLHRLFLSGALHGHVSNMWVQILLRAFGTTSFSWDIIRWLNISQPGTPSPELPVPMEPTPPVFPIFPPPVPDVPITPVFNNTYYPQWILNISVILGNGNQNFWEIIRRFNITVPKINNPGSGVSPPGLNYTTTVELLWIKQIFAAIESGPENPETQYIKKYLLYRLYLSGALRGHVDNMWVKILLCAFGKSSSTWNIINRLNISQPLTHDSGAPVFNNTYCLPCIPNISGILGQGNENVLKIIHRFNITVPKFDYPGSGVSPPGLNYKTTVELLWIKQIFAAIGSGTGDPEIQYLKKYLLYRLYLSGALRGHVDYMWVKILLNAFGKSSSTWKIINRLNISQHLTHDPIAPVFDVPITPVFDVPITHVFDVPITPVFNNTFYSHSISNMFGMLGMRKENVKQIIHTVNISVPTFSHHGSRINFRGLN